MRKRFVRPIKVEKKTLSQQVAEQIQRMIEDQSFEQGANLPTETELAEAFGVSRTVIREALNTLKAKGLVSIQPGRGTVVSSVSRQYVEDTIRLYLRSNYNGIEVFERLYEVRALLECKIAELAALRRTEEQLDQLRAAMRDMKEGAGDDTLYTRADLVFHMCLAQATQNEFFPLLLKPFTESLIEVIYLGRREPGGVESGISAHEKIVRCVEEGDAEGARQAMMAHIEDSRRRIEAHLQAKTAVSDAGTASRG